MRIFRVVYIVLASLLILFSCQRKGVGIDSYNDYNYLAYDSTGVLIVSGTLWLAINDSSGHISGHWRFNRRSRLSGTGPQIGTGILEGQTIDGIAYINLNPEEVDNNIVLKGQFEAYQFRGEWQWVGYPGEINQGTFIATIDDDQP